MPCKCPPRHHLLFANFRSQNSILNADRWEISSIRCQELIEQFEKMIFLIISNDERGVPALIWRWIARKKKTPSPLVAPCRRWTIKGAFMPHEWQNVWRSDDKGPPERQSIAVSRSLTDIAGERIYCAVNNGAAWQLIAPAYLHSVVSDPSLCYPERYNGNRICSLSRESTASPSALPQKKDISCSKVTSRRAILSECSLSSVRFFLILCKNFVSVKS